MSLLITGGLGFLGQQIAKRFLRAGGVWSAAHSQVVPLRQLVLFDVGFPDAPLAREITSDSRVQVKTGDLTDEGVPAELIDTDEMCVVHLASMVSGNTEADPERGWQVNVEGQRALLAAVRERAPGSRFLFTSSTASLGAVGESEPTPDDRTKLVPQNSYGFHKAVCEMMLNDASRRGYVDGRALRLPVIIVRPGAPNAAAVSDWSSIVREPLAGKPCPIGVPLDATLPCASYQTVAAAAEFVLNDVDAADLGADRTLMLPSLPASPAELHAAALEVAREHGLRAGEVEHRPDERIAAIVGGMVSRTDGARARALGLPADGCVREVVEAYAEDWVLPAAEGSD